jgi:alpha-tubulin suppressor-like RCC1 family protein
MEALLFRIDNQLGVGGGLAMDMFTMESIPVLIDGFGGKKVTHVACGQDHAAAITEDGRMYMWGSKLWLEPHEMTALSHVNVIAVSCGRRYTAALTECGKVFTFGKGSTNALGHGDRKSQLQPLQISSLANFNVTSINCGETHMAAIIEPHGHAADKDFSFRE